MSEPLLSIDVACNISLILDVACNITLICTTVPSSRSCRSITSTGSSVITSCMFLSKTRLLSHILAPRVQQPIQAFQLIVPQFHVLFTSQILRLSFQFRELGPHFQCLQQWHSQQNYCNQQRCNAQFCVRIMSASWSEYESMLTACQAVTPETMDSWTQQ